MRSLVYYVAASLDGYIADADGGFSAFATEGDHMAYLATEFADAFPTFAHEPMGIDADGSTFGTVLMGWSTYAVGLPHGMRSPYAHLRQYVVSSTHGAHDVPDDVTLTDDPQAVVRAEKAADVPGDVWLCGGGRLAYALVGEIDRLVLKVNPVIFGDGIPLFAGPVDPMTFSLSSSRTFDSGVIVNDHRRA